MDCYRWDGASPGNLGDRRHGRWSERYRQGQRETEAELSDRCSSPNAQLTDRQITDSLLLSLLGSQHMCLQTQPESQTDGQLRS